MSGKRHYELRIFDTTLISFSIGDSPFGPEVSIEDYDSSMEYLLPCGISVSSDGVWQWLETRSIPTNRKNAAQICKSLGFDLGDLEALYNTSLGLSLNDSYWVVPKDFTGKFADYNLFDNGFSTAIGALAVATEPAVSNLAGNTPELTTDGTLRKGWRIVDSRRVLYKGSSDGFVPGEAVSEYIASLVAADCGLNSVNYSLDTWEGELCSTCEDFATQQTSYVPFAIATGETSLGGVLRWCSELGVDCLESVCDMLVFDALVCNTDRHLANFGLLRDNFSGNPIALAPIFDNGRSLFPNVADDSPSQFLLESQLRVPAFGGASYEELVGRIKGERQQHILERVLERGIVGNVKASRRRVAALDEFIRERAEALLALPVVKHEDLVSALRARVALKSEGETAIHLLNPTRA